VGSGKSPLGLGVGATGEDPPQAAIPLQIAMAAVASERQGFAE
jgi:hypothetical protein